MKAQHLADQLGTVHHRFTVRRNKAGQRHVETDLDVFRRGGACRQGNARHMTKESGLGKFRLAKDCRQP